MFKGMIQRHFHFYLEISGVRSRSQSAEKMAQVMMEAIAAFSRKHQNSGLHLVRVVIFQRDLLPTYVDQMVKVTKVGLLDMVTSPLKKLVKGKVHSLNVFKIYNLTTCSSKSRCQLIMLAISMCLPLELNRTYIQKAGNKYRKKSIEFPIDVDRALPTTKLSSEFIILGLNQENIQAAKRQIDHCCQTESTHSSISGPEYSDIIKILTATQVLFYLNLKNEFLFMKP